MNTTENTRGLMIGCGNMGSALLMRWQHEIGLEWQVVTRQSLQPYELRKCSWSHDLEAALSANTPGFVVLAVKPAQITTVLKKIAGHLASDTLIVSIAAGVTLSALKAASGSARVARMMPNTPVSVGAGVTAICGTSSLGDDAITLLQRLATASGKAVWLDSEDKLDRVTALCGSGPAYQLRFLEAFEESAISLGFSADEARDLALNTALGTCKLAKAAPKTFATLREEVTSPNGTTAAGVNALNDATNLEMGLISAVHAAHRRAVEIGKAV